jgi:hypothetical protein
MTIKADLHLTTQHRDDPTEKKNFVTVKTNDKDTTSRGSFNLKVTTFFCRVVVW